MLSPIWIELFTKVPLNFVISENSQNLFSYLTRDMNYENWKQKSNQAKIHVMGPIKIKWWVMETQQTNWLSNTIGSLGLTHNFFFFFFFFFFEKHNTQPGQEFQLSTFNFQLSTIQWSKSTLARMDKHLFITMKGQMFPLVNRWILLGIIHTIFVPLKLNHQRFQLASRSINWSCFTGQVYVKLQERHIENHTQSQSSPFVQQIIRNGPINNQRDEERPWLIMLFMDFMKTSWACNMVILCLGGREVIWQKWPSPWKMFILKARLLYTININL